MNDFNDKFPHDEDEQEVAGIQIDLYGIKAEITPEEGLERPRSWREVASRLNQYLMSICDGAIGLVDDTFSAARILVRGIGNIPGALAKRIEGAHQRADEIELRKQMLTATTKVMAGPAPMSLELEHEGAPSTEDVLRKFQAKGIAAELHRRPDGTYAILIVRPENVEQAKLLLEQVDDSPAELILKTGIEAAIRLRTGGMIRGLMVSLDGTELTIKGRTTTFYNKQLATHAALDAVKGREIRLMNDIELD